MCVLIFSTVLSETFLILRRIQRDMIIIVHKSLCKVLDILVEILMKLEFSRQIKEKYANIKFLENPSVVTGQTDIAKLMFAFRNFANAHRLCCEGKGEDYLQVLNTTTSFKCYSNILFFY
jgi:hypothetical protein